MVREDHPYQWFNIRALLRAGVVHKILTGWLTGKYFIGYLRLIILQQKRNIKSSFCSIVAKISDRNMHEEYIYHKLHCM